MGGNQATIFPHGQPLCHYDLIQKVPLHNITYLKHKITSKQYLIKQFAINDKTQFNQLIQKLKLRKKLQSYQYVTKLQRYSQQFEDNLCSSFYKVYAMWQYPSHTLQDQIKQRQLQKRKFQENQLFSIIACVIEGMSCLQSSGIKHQNLTTTSIRFDQIGAIKITDPITQINISNFQKITTNRSFTSNNNIYIAPQQCQSLKNQRPIPNRNPFKSDVFILGIILLQCGLLQPINNIYIDNYEDIDFDQLSKKLDQFGKLYTRDLKLTVQTMLTRDPKERMDWLGLKQYIPQKKQDKSAMDNHLMTGNQKNYQNYNLLKTQTKFNNKTILDPINLNFDSFKKSQNKQTNGIKLVLGSKQPTNINTNPINVQSSLNYALNQPQSYTSIGNNYPPNLNSNYSSGSNNYSYKPSFLMENNLKQTPLFQAHTQRPTQENYLIPSTVSKITTTNPFQQKDSSFPYGYFTNQSNSINLNVPPYQYGTNNQRSSEINMIIGGQQNLGNLGTTSSSTLNYLNINNLGYTNNTKISNLTQGTSAFASSQLNNYTPYSKPLEQYKTTSTNINFQNTHLTSIPQIQNYLQNGNQTFKYNFENTSTSQIINSPFGHHIKDAKSITYDKNTNGSFIENQKVPNSGLIQNINNNNVGVNYTVGGQNLNPDYLYNQFKNYSSSGNGYTNNNYVNNHMSSYNNNPTNIQSNNNSNHLSVPKNLYQPLSSNSKIQSNTQINPNSLINKVIPNTNLQQSTQIYQYRQISNIGGQTTNKNGNTNVNFSSTKLQPNNMVKAQNSILQNSNNLSNKKNQKGTNRKMNGENIHSKQDIHSNSNNKNFQLQYVVQHFKQGSRYQGTKHQDMRHGQGKFFYQDGGMYDGNWKLNKMDGFGKLYYQSSKIAYQGNWKDDQFQGYGKLYNEQPDILQEFFDYENFDLIDQFWVYYEGNFIQDEKDGQGKMMFSNGQFFIGNFHKDMVDGQGQFHKKNGQVVKGVWSQNQLVQIQQ